MVKEIVANNFKNHLLQKTKLIMDRKEFISLLGIGAITALTASQISGCSKDDEPNSGGIDFSLDLNAAANTVLLSSGGYLIKDNIIIAHTLADTYIAVSSVCTHQGSTVEFLSGTNKFHCPNHDSEFSTTGSVIKGPASKPLKSYNTELSGSSLRVFS
jgi:cytochrome b6-f complex iron-sulfur subunit